MSSFIPYLKSNAKNSRIIFCRGCICVSPNMNLMQRMCNQDDCINNKVKMATFPVGKNIDIQSSVFTGFTEVKEKKQVI